MTSYFNTPLLNPERHEKLGQAFKIKGPTLVCNIYFFNPKKNLMLFPLIVKLSFTVGKYAE
jgi:hypothetical protein